MPLSLLVVLSNLYIVITFMLGITLLHEPVTVLKIGGLVVTLVGVLQLPNPPSSRDAVRSATSVAKKAPPARAFLGMGSYVVIIGIGAFLEKPALRGLDATQLNGLMAIAMTAVALVAFAVEGPSVFLQLFALFARFSPAGSEATRALPRSHYAQAVVMYAAVGLTPVLTFLVGGTNTQVTDASGVVWQTTSIAESAATVSIFTMILEVALSAVRLLQSSAKAPNTSVREETAPKRVLLTAE